MSASAGCQLLGRWRIIEAAEISGCGYADLANDGTIEIELSFHNGDDAVLKAHRQ